MRNSSRLNVCFLAGTLEHGGAERQLYYMLQTLRQSGMAPRLLCLDRGEFWERRIQSLGVPMTWVGQRPSRLARLVRVLRELRADPPDLVQSQHFFANGYVGLCSRLLAICGIGAVRNGWAAELQKNGPIGGWLNLRLPRLLAANSRLAIKQAIAGGVPSSRLYFLPNVVDTRQFKPAENSGERSVTLIAVGRAVREKRLDRFIVVLWRLRAVLKLDVRGWIVGPTQDDGLRQQLETLAAKLGLVPPYLRFLGGVSNMAPLYHRADICVLTSDYEGTPNVLLEAMASGLPVVATNVGGVPDIVQDGVTGLLVERDDKEVLLAALAELVKDRPRRLEMGRRAREFVETGYSLERLPENLLNLYDLVLAPGRRRKLGAIESNPA